jgi:hypothetical protein
VTNIARTKIKICQYESASFVTTASPGEFQILESQLGYARYTAMNASFYSDVVGIGCVGQTIHYYYANKQAKTVSHFKYDTSTDIMSEMDTTSSFVSIRIADNLDNFLAYITYGDVHTYSAKLRDAFDSEVIDILNADRNSWYIQPLRILSKNNPMELKSRAFTCHNKNKIEVFTYASIAYCSYGY